jgi:hypothetical protein
VLWAWIRIEPPAPPPLEPAAVAVHFTPLLPLLAIQPVAFTVFAATKMMPPPLPPVVP